MRLSIYRYDPDKDAAPYMKDYDIELEPTDRMLLDALIREIDFEPQWRLDPVAMSDAFKQVLPEAPELMSGAGHDAMFLAAAGVPTAMLFVRSLNGGISHHPDELSSEDDIALTLAKLKWLRLPGMATTTTASPEAWSCAPNTRCLPKARAAICRRR